MSVNRLIAMACLCLAGSASSFAATRINPEAGLWEQTTMLSPDGKSWHPGTKTKGCLSEAQASAWESQVRQQIAAASCTVNSLSVVNGTIDGVIACSSINKPVVNLEGDYSKTAYSVNLVSSGVVDLRKLGGSANAPVTVFAKWTGARVGDC